MKGLAIVLAVAALSQAPAPTLITGTLERLVAEDIPSSIELGLSTDRDLPGVAAGDRVFRVNTPMFRPPGAPAGLPVAFVETGSGGFLFVDANLDGRLTESERRSYTPGTNYGSAHEVSFSLTPAVPGAPPTLRCRGCTDDRDRRLLRRALGRAGPRGACVNRRRRTLIALPYSVGRRYDRCRRRAAGHRHKRRRRARRARIWSPERPGSTGSGRHSCGAIGASRSSPGLATDRSC